jgi:hypothetical protein
LQSLREPERYGRAQGMTAMREDEEDHAGAGQVPLLLTDFANEIARDAGKRSVRRPATLYERHATRPHTR